MHILKSAIWCGLGWGTAWGSELVVQYIGAKFLIPVWWEEEAAELLPAVKKPSRRWWRKSRDLPCWPERWEKFWNKKQQEGKGKMDRAKIFWMMIASQMCRDVPRPRKGMPPKPSAQQRRMLVGGGGQLCIQHLRAAAWVSSNSASLKLCKTIIQNFRFLVLVSDRRKKKTVGFVQSWCKLSVSEVFPLRTWCLCHFCTISSPSASQVMPDN